MTIDRLMLLVAIIALVMADARLVVAILAIAGVAVLLPNARRWAMPYFVTLACVYLPFSWLVLIDYPWNSYRWHWIEIWPIAPGLAAGLPFHRSKLAESTVAGLATLSLVALLTRLGAIGRKSLIAANGIALALEAMVGFVAYHLFLF